jgi:hypothetical protein
MSTGDFGCVDFDLATTLGTTAHYAMGIDYVTECRLGYTYDYLLRWEAPADGEYRFVGSSSLDTSFSIHAGCGGATLLCAVTFAENSLALRAGQAVVIVLKVWSEGGFVPLTIEPL